MSYPNWPVDDKKTLLLSLREYGAHNMEQLQKNLPHRTVTEIHDACDFYSKQALKKWEQSKEHSKAPEKPAIKAWMDVFKRIKTAQKGQVHDVIPRVLKYIALFEKRESSEHVDLKECYLFLSDLCSGIAPRKLDSSSDFFIRQCLLKLSKPIMRGENEKLMTYFRTLRDIMHNAEELNTHNSSSGNFSPVLNPLNMPNSFLHRSDFEKNQPLFD